MEQIIDKSAIVPPKIKQGIPTIYGLVIIGVIFIVAILAFIFFKREQEMTPPPLIYVERHNGKTGECVAGGDCIGPTIRAEDPEGDQLTYKFFDKETGQLVSEIKADSGEAVTPEFNFSSAGEKQLYMVVEDGSGHTSKDYPIIIPVKSR